MKNKKEVFGIVFGMFVSFLLIGNIFNVIF